MWLATPARPAAAVRLFCFPHAGGSAGAFNRWGRAGDPGLEVRAAELPGRASRQAEAPFSTFGALLEAAVPAMLPLLDRPFALYGHSMGALAAVEAARRVRSHGGPAPEWLFVSGEPAPATAPPSRLDRLADDDLLAEVRRLGGTPEAVLQDPGMRQYVLALLRADFRVLASYRYEAAAPLPCPIIAFGGRADPDLSADKLEAWRTETTSHFSVRWLECGHFHTPESERLVLSEIERALLGRA
jgi:surfactin synthase thioesterase subunit